MAYFCKIDMNKKKIRYVSCNTWTMIRFQVSMSILVTKIETYRCKIYLHLYNLSLDNYTWLDVCDIFVALTRRKHLLNHYETFVLILQHMFFFKFLLFYFFSFEIMHHMTIIFFYISIRRLYITYYLQHESPQISTRLLLIFSSNLKLPWVFY